MLNDRFWDPNKPKPPKKHKVIQEYGIEGLTEKEEAAAGAIYDYAEPTYGFVMGVRDILLYSIFRQNWLIIGLLGRIAGSLAKGKE